VKTGLRGGDPQRVSKWMGAANAIMLVAIIVRLFSV
jgi:hypothetical protein